MLCCVCWLVFAHADMGSSKKEREKKNKDRERKAKKKEAQDWLNGGRADALQALLVRECAHAHARVRCRIV